MKIDSTSSENLMYSTYDGSLAYKYLGGGGGGGGGGQLVLISISLCG